MNISIPYCTKTGITKQAAENIAALLKEKGHNCTVTTVEDADVDKIAAADLIITGCWTAGLFFILGHPVGPWKEFVSKLPDLKGKSVAVYCTYKLRIGPMLKKMTGLINSKNGEVQGQFSFRGPDPDDDFRKFADTL